MSPEELFTQWVVLKARHDFDRGLYSNGYDAGSIESDLYRKEHDFLTANRTIELSKRSAS